MVQNVLVKHLKLLMFVLIFFLVLFTLPSIYSVSGASQIDVHPAIENHVAELNSNQPYVAGFHVYTPDLQTRGSLNATSITVSFPSVDTEAFSEDSWLGVGMFLQAQDSKFLHIDYGFYMMLVVDANGRLFVDVGLHQTRESSQPFQNPPSELIYAYTWQISASNSSIPINLSAHWDQEGNVHYFIFAEQTNFTLISINVPSLPNCENIIRKFYAGNAVVGAFPISVHVNYFQFGVISSEIIDNTCWVVSLKNPNILKTGRVAVGRVWREEGEKGWFAVDRAWTVQGDNSFLDADWMWGGKPYPGVDIQVQLNLAENSREALFSYTGKTLKPGAILWEGSDFIANDFHFQLDFRMLVIHFSLCIILCGYFNRFRLKYS